MYCRKCGKELAPDSSFCNVCGTPVDSDSLTSAKPETEVAKAGAEVAKAGAEVAKARVEIARGTPEGAGITDISPKSRLAVTLLSLFLGEFGVHRFYLKKIGSAVGMLILGIIGIIFWPFGMIPVGIWALVDFIVGVSGNMKDKQGRPIKKW